jgi:hypothetical protein
MDVSDPGTISSKIMDAYNGRTNIGDDADALPPAGRRFCFVCRSGSFLGTRNYCSTGPGRRGAVNAGV